MLQVIRLTLSLLLLSFTPFVSAENGDQWSKAIMAELRMQLKIMQDQRALFSITKHDETASVAREKYQYAMWYIQNHTLPSLDAGFMQEYNAEVVAASRLPEYRTKSFFSSLKFIELVEPEDVLRRTFFSEFTFEEKMAIVYAQGDRFFSIGRYPTFVKDYKQQLEASPPQIRELQLDAISAIFTHLHNAREIFSFALVMSVTNAAQLELLKHALTNLMSKVPTKHTLGGLSTVISKMGTEQAPAVYANLSAMEMNNNFLFTSEDKVGPSSGQAFVQDMLRDTTGLGEKLLHLMVKDQLHARASIALIAMARVLKDLNINRKQTYIFLQHIENEEQVTRLENFSRDYKNLLEYTPEGSSTSYTTRQPLIEAVVETIGLERTSHNYGRHIVSGDAPRITTQSGDNFVRALYEIVGLTAASVACEATLFSTSAVVR